MKKCKIKLYIIILLIIIILIWAIFQFNIDPEKNQINSYDGIDFTLSGNILLLEKLDNKTLEVDFNSKDYAIFRHYLITLENIKECRDYNMFSNIHDGFCLKEFPTELEIRYSYVNYILETGEYREIGNDFMKSFLYGTPSFTKVFGQL